VGQEQKVAPMITDSNHACFTKMSGCGFSVRIEKRVICFNYKETGLRKFLTEIQTPFV
jgi:hypothetical protein